MYKLTVNLVGINANEGTNEERKLKVSDLQGISDYINSLRHKVDGRYSIEIIEAQKETA